MSQFFGCISDGRGTIFYFDHKIRKKILSGESNYEVDSHTSIASFFKKDEDKMNKYEYNPITKVFIVDQINNIKNDSACIKKLCRKLDFKAIVPELEIKPIFHPFKNADKKRVTKKDLELLKKWASVRASVWDSVRASVGASVWASVWDSVWDSVGASVWDSVRDSVWASVWASVRDSGWAYTSVYFNLKKWKYIKHKQGENPFQAGIDLWYRGLVPSYDGKIWRLHGGKKGKILWSGKI